MAIPGLDFRKVAQFDERDVERLLSASGIVRHRGKIEAVISNAVRACEMVEAEGSLAAFLWRFKRVPDSTPNSRFLRSKAFRNTGTEFIERTLRLSTSCARHSHRPRLLMRATSCERG